MIALFLGALFLAAESNVWLLVCLAVLIVNIYLVVGIIALILGSVNANWRWPFIWAGNGWGGLIVAAIISMLFYGHCGFLRLPV